jgi:MFS family permease
MVVMSYFCAIIVLGLWLPARSNAAIIVFAILYGFGSGAFVGLGPALIAQISDVRQIGVRTGTMFAIVSVAALTGSPIGGALVTADQGRFTKLQIFAGAVMVAGSTFFFAARVILGGWSWRSKV